MTEEWGMVTMGDGQCDGGRIEVESRRAQWHSLDFLLQHNLGEAWMCGLIGNGPHGLLAYNERVLLIGSAESQGMHCHRA
jgi:hypothetical protein